MSMRDAQAAYDAAEPEEPPTCAVIHGGITLRALQSELENRGLLIDEVRSYRRDGRVEYSAIVSDGRGMRGAQGEGWASDLSQAISLAVADCGVRDA